MAPRNFSEDGAQGATGDPTMTSSGGFGAAASPGQIPAGSPGNMFGYNPFGNKSGVSAPTQAGVGVTPGMFEDGGAIPDPGDGDADDSSQAQPQAQPQPQAGAGDLNQTVALALGTVDQGLDYGRQKFGLSNGNGPEDPQGMLGAPETGKSMPSNWNTPGGGHDYSNFRRADEDIEDRRENDPTKNQPEPGVLGKAAAMASDFGERAMRSGKSEVQRVTNPMSKALGINDISNNGAMPEPPEEK